MGHKKKWEVSVQELPYVTWMMSEYECVRKQQKNQSITLHQSEVAFLGKQIIQKLGFACEISFLSTPPHPHYTTLLLSSRHISRG